MMKQNWSKFTALTLILFLAACGGTDNEETEQPEENASGGAENSITIQAMNWQFDEEEYTAEAGETTFELINTDGNHGIIIKGADAGDDLVINGEGTATATLEPGEYVIECSIPCGSGHTDMVSTLIVS